MNTYGQDKVLFATNFPMLSLEKCAKQAVALDLKPEAKTSFLSGNARRVFGIAQPVG
jgi:predicted TIM-barrel fold metal-dependent hydrolase